MDQELREILAQTLSSDNAKIHKAFETLNNFIRNDFNNSILSLTNILLNDNEDDGIRIQAIIQLKNFLKSMDITWKHSKKEFKKLIFKNVVSSLNCEKVKKELSGSCISLMLEEEDDSKCNMIIEELIAMALNSQILETKRACLITLGCIYSEKDKVAFQNLSNKVLTCFINSINCDSSSSVSMAALNSLSNALYYFGGNFSQEPDCKLIVDTLCNILLKSSNVELKLCSLQCMNASISIYYDVISSLHLHYMIEVVLKILSDTIENLNDNLILECLNIISSICEFEILMIENTDKDVEKFLINKKHVELVKIIIPNMYYKADNGDEEDEDEEWNVRKAATVCLTLIAKCCDDTIFTTVLNFISEKLKSKDWKAREVALLALGSILPSLSEDLLSQEFNDIICYAEPLINNKNFKMCHTAIWVIGKLLEEYPLCCTKLPNHFLEYLIPIMIKYAPQLSSSSHLLENLNKAYFVILEDSGKVKPPTYQLSKYHSYIISNLFDNIKKNNNDTNLRVLSSQFFCLQEFVSESAEDCYGNILKLKDLVFNELTIYSQQDNSYSDEVKLEQMKLHICSLYEAILKRLNFEDLKSTGILNVSLLIDLLNNSYGSDNFEDVLLIFSPIIEAIGDDFVPYIDNFYPLVIGSLDPSMCSRSLRVISLGILSDLVMSIGVYLKKYMDHLMRAICLLFTDPSSDLSVKIPIVYLMGDLAMNTYFSPFYKQAFSVLKAAFDYKEFEEDEYNSVIELKISIYKTYSMIIQGIKDQPDLLNPFISLIVVHVVEYLNDFEISLKLISPLVILLVDLMDNYTTLFLQLLKVDVLKNFLNWLKNINNPEIRNITKIALKKLDEICAEEIEMNTK